MVADSSSFDMEMGMAVASKAVSAVYEKCKADRDEDGVAAVNAVEVAKLIRAKLAEKFPGVKFSVKKSSSDSVSVSWTDGPCTAAVNEVVKSYGFGGFDGSIDMAYSKANWLLPDGSMVPASSTGTQGSMGYVPGFATDCPKPGAVLVKYGPSYIFTSKEHSDEVFLKLCELAAAEHGASVDPDVPLYKQVVDGEYLTSLAREYETEQWEQSKGI